MPDIPALSMPFMLMNLPVLWIVVSLLSREWPLLRLRRAPAPPRGCPHCLACSGACRPNPEA